MTDSARVRAEATSLDDMAARLELDAQRHGEASAAVDRHLEALSVAVTSPDAVRLQREGATMLDAADGVPCGLGTAASTLRTAASTGRDLAERLHVLERRRDDLVRQQTRGDLVVATVTGGASGSGVDLFEIGRQMGVVHEETKLTLEQWSTACRTADATVREVADVVSSSARLLDASWQRTVRARRHARRRAYAAGRLTADVHGVVDATSTLEQAGTRTVRRHQVRGAESRLRDLERVRKRSVPDYRTTHPHLNRAARRDLRARDQRHLKRAVPQARRDVSIARANLDTRQPLTRAGARLRTISSNPVFKGAGKVLGPIGFVAGAAEVWTSTRSGDHENAVLSGVGLAGSALVFTPFAPVGAALVVGATVIQNREHIAAGARWVGAKVKGGTKKLFGRSRR